MAEILRVTIYKMPEGSEKAYKAMVDDGISEGRSGMGDTPEAAEADAVASFKATIPQKIVEKQIDAETGEEVVAIVPGGEDELESENPPVDEGEITDGNPNPA